MSDRNGFDRPALSAPMFVQAYLPAGAFARGGSSRLISTSFSSRSFPSRSGLRSPF
jgi:hypothetical protein